MVVQIVNAFQAIEKVIKGRTNESTWHNKKIGFRITKFHDFDTIICCFAQILEPHTPSGTGSYGRQDSDVILMNRVCCRSKHSNFLWHSIVTAIAMDSYGFLGQIHCKVDFNKVKFCKIF